MRQCGGHRSKPKGVGTRLGLRLRVGLGLGQHRQHGVGGGGAVSGWAGAAHGVERLGRQYGHGVQRRPLLPLVQPDDEAAAQ